MKTTTQTTRLTPAQKLALAFYADKATRAAARATGAPRAPSGVAKYAPSSRTEGKLLELGFIAADPTWNGMYGRTFVITDAGRAVLEAK